MDIDAVVRGEFRYRDVLLVDCGGELKRHARAHEAEIRLRLNGQDNDQVGHWWEAQLIHYDLKRSKQKDTCKVRLQQALNEGRLRSQPVHLADMEAQMKKDYAASCRKARAQLASPIVPLAKGVKRARAEDGERSTNSTRIKVTVGDITLDIEEATLEKGKAKRPAVESSNSVKKATSTRPTRDVPSSLSKTSRQLAKRISDPRMHPDNVFQRGSFKSSSSNGTTPSRPTKSKQETDTKATNSRPRSRPTKTKSGPPEDPDMPYDTFYEDEVEEMDLRPDITQDQLSVTGTYDLSCPELADQSPEHADQFLLSICVDNRAGQIWGAFELAWKSGHIKIDDIAYNTPLTLGWRARDYEVPGSLRFGKGCFGEMQFLGRGEVRGSLYGLFPETVEFEGVRRPGPLWCGKSAYKFRQEWEEYPREAYGR